MTTEKPTPQILTWDWETLEAIRVRTGLGWKEVVDRVRMAFRSGQAVCRFTDDDRVEWKIGVKK